MLYLVGGTIEGKNVLFLDKSNAFQGSENMKEAEGLLPDLNGHHKAGHTWSTGASIWWMQFQPKLMEFKNLDEVASALLDRSVKKYSGMAGSVTATPLKDDFVVRVVKNSSLIDEGFNTTKPFYEQRA